MIAQLLLVERSSAAGFMKRPTTAGLRRAMLPVKATGDGGKVTGANKPAVQPVEEEAQKSKPVKESKVSKFWLLVAERILQTLLAAEVKIFLEWVARKRLQDKLWKFLLYSPVSPKVERMIWFVLVVVLDKCAHDLNEDIKEKEKKE